MRNINTRTVKITPRTEIFNLYTQEIAKFPILEKDEEADLFTLYSENKNPKIKEKLIKSNLRFVISVVKTYRQNTHNFDEISLDLISEGNIGLTLSVDKFDVTRGFKFISYAVWNIRKEIMQFLRTMNQTVRRPLNVSYLCKKIDYFSDKFYKENSYYPSPEEICENITINNKPLTPQQFNNAFDLYMPNLRVDSPVSNSIDNASSHLEIHILDNEKQIFDFNSFDKKAVLEKATIRLNSIEKSVFEFLYIQNKTALQTTELVEVSEPKLRKIRDSIENKLKNNKELKQYILT